MTDPGILRQNERTKRVGAHIVTGLMAPDWPAVKPRISTIAWNQLTAWSTELNVNGQM